ncbi:unnamed protein product [Caenorhabditis angaria]|uniref:Uncharacterized protein n=1 Tax=Caenorhabditis angaria TaxID=860376 RepID=A0A9P1IIW7_9PELO|nr:unnamed protein product [Caenorhabditis angaria]
MNEDDQFEEFLLPVERGAPQHVLNDEMISGGVYDSPTRKFGAMLGEIDPKIPESPDMKFARKRLGNLLTTIKQHPVESITMPDSLIPSSSAAPATNEEQTEKRGRPPGRPRKIVEPNDTKKNNEVMDLSPDQSIMFELRGKPFELVAGRSDCEYTLCRAWVRGDITKEHPAPTTLRQEFAPNLAVEYLACREIHKMPRASNAIAEMPMLPKKVDEFDKSIDPEKIGVLRVEYSRHWKAVKKGWLAHQRKRNAKYAKSISLLEKIFTPPELRE